MPREGILFILVGPSGAGKNSLMKRVQKQIVGLPQLATATTRDKRPEEQPGREHVFVTESAFKQLIDTDALIEYQPVHSGKWYGTPRQTVEDAIHSGQDLIADIEFLGAGKIYAQYPDHTVLIFVTPSSLDILNDRIRQRGGVTQKDLEHRLARVRFEMTFAPHCPYLIINDLFEPAAEHLRQIILSERARRRNESLDGIEPLRPPLLHSYVIALVQHGEHVLVKSDADVMTFPRFPFESTTDAPHDVLQAYVSRELSADIKLNIIEDERFDFVAPHYAETAVLPNDNYLYLYYQCTAPTRLTIPGWEWVPSNQLTLSAALRQLVQSESTRMITVNT